MYAYPSFLPKPLQSGYSVDEMARFQISQPSAGAYYSQIVSDDAPAYFNLRFVMPLYHAEVFRAWLTQDNYAILTGAQFEIDLPTEHGILTQTASFTPDGIPQKTGESGKLIFYSAKVMVRKVVDPNIGNESLILSIASLGNPALLDTIVNIDMPEL